MKNFLLLIAVTIPICIIAQKEIYFSFNIQNDFLNYRCSGTDQYYTGGNTMSLSFKGKKKPHIVHTVSISQRVFSPDDILRTDLNGNDFPYAGLLYLSYSRSVFFNDSLASLQYQISAGTTGEKAFAADVQSALHRWLNVYMPLGWNNQIDLGNLLQFEFNYNRSLIRHKAIHVNTLAGLEFGTIFTRASIGGELKLGGGGNFSAHQFGLIPALTGKKRGFYAFARPAVTYVLYNEMFSKAFGSTKELAAIKKDISLYVFKSAIGISYYTRKFAVTLVQNYNTREFSAALDHSFGEINFLFRL